MHDIVLHFNRYDLVQNLAKYFNGLMDCTSGKICPNGLCCADVDTFDKDSVLAIPLRKLLIEYIGKHNLSKEETYRHFLQNVHNIARSPTAINIAVIIVFRKTICFSCSRNVSSQFGGKVGGQNVNSLQFYNSERVNAFTLLFEFVVGLTNLYSSITAELKMMLSRMQA